MNGAGLEAGNDLMVDGRDLPWLQDQSSVDVWSLWSVEYRDVVILDGEGVRTYVVNLSEYGLDDARRLTAFEELLRSLADE